MNNTTKEQMIVKEEFFSTPDMGEYMSSKNLVQTVGKEDIKEGEKALFYVERPFDTVPGYYKNENVFIISGAPVWSNAHEYKYNPSLSKFDGDTLYLSFNEISDGGQTFIVDGVPFNNIKDFIYKTHDMDKTIDELGIRFLGIDAPETPKYRIINNAKGLLFCEVSVSDLFTENSIRVKMSNGKKATINTSAFKFVKYRVSEGKFESLTSDPKNKDKKIKFVSSSVDIDKKVEMYEVVDASNINAEFESDLKSKNDLFICVGNEGPADDAEYHRQGLKAISMVKDEIEKASEVIYVLDGTTLSTKKGLPKQYQDPWIALAESPGKFFKELWDFCTEEGTSKYNKGFRFFGQELNGRCLGAVYLRTVEDGKSVWINLAKKILYEYNKVVALPSYGSIEESANFGYAANIFKLWTYDKSKVNFIDSFVAGSLSHDDRHDIQKSINPMYEKDGFKNHTMMFGDCLFVVPPTSIRLVNQTESMRVPLMRAKGSLVKSIPKTERIIEIDLFFNKEDGINGTEIAWPLPSGSEAIYHMNGIRSIIAQYKLTPFLPITNNYINNDLNIEAVTLNSYNISTVPNFPRTLKCTLTLSEFNYRQYMPEILPPDASSGEDIYTNLFAKTIHWPVFRYYYQRLIQAGEVLEDVEYNSEEYISKTLGQRTALQRSHFKDPMISFYVANEEALKKRQQLKKELETTPIDSKIEFTKEEREFLFNLGKLYGQVSSGLNVAGPEKGCYDELNKLISEGLNKDSEYAVCGYSDLVENSIEISLDDSNTVGSYKIQKLKRKFPEIDKFHVWRDNVVGGTRILNNELYSKTKTNTTVAKIVPWYKLNKASKTESGESIIFIGTKMELDWAQCPTVGFEEKIRKFTAKKLGLEEKEVFKNGQLLIGYSAAIDKDPVLGTSYYPFTETFKTASTKEQGDLKLLSLIANLFGMQFDNSGNLQNEDEVDVDAFFDEMDVIGGIKDDLDIESAKSITFDEYFIGYPIVTATSFSYNNILNSTSLKAVDGYSAQYMGGSDTVIDVSMIAKDDFTVRQINALSNICTRRLIDYRKIMTSSPLRVKCDIAQMMGINEVIIESVSINTVEDQPGIKEINIRMVSIDRTLRNRESLKKLDTDNAQNRLDMGVTMKNYFDLKNVLKRVELYPDLELPTITELSMHGFEYIKYKMKEDLIFPDPDFYFVYNHLFTSDAIRDTITNFFSEDEKTEAIKEVVDSFSPEIKSVKFNYEDEEGPLSEEKKKQANSDGTFESYKRKYLSQAEEIMSNIDTETYNSKNEWKANYDAKNAYTQGKLVSELKECLQYSNEGTVTYNIMNKPSVSCGKPLGLQESLMLTDKVAYIGDDGILYTGTPGDTITAMNNTLKYFIKDILSKPIPKTGVSGKSVAEHPDYEKFFKYLLFEVMKVKKNLDYTSGSNPLNVKVNYEIEGWFDDIDLTYAEVMKDLFISLSSGASGEIGRISAGVDSDNNNWKGSNMITLTHEKDGQVVTEKVENIRYIEKGQGISSIAVANSDKEKAEGMMFGQYGIKKVSPSFLSNLFGIALMTAENGFIDPYYNKSLSKAFLGKEITDDEAAAREKEYREFIMEGDESKGKSSHAIFRNLLVWMYRALSTENQGIVSNSIYSIRRAEEYVDEILDMKEGFGKDLMDWFHGGWNSVKTAIFSGDEAVQREKEIEKEIAERRDEIDDQAKELVKGLPKAIKCHKMALFNGMWTMMGMLSLGEFNTPVWGAIQRGVVGDLDNYLISQKDGYVETEKVEGFVNLRINRFLQSMDYIANKNASDIVRYTDKMNDFKPGSISNRVYMKMAEKPSIYMLHSFYDMVINDYRGRMARAFPTFYMLLIDEGKHIGVWKLQDNFYDVSSLTEIQVVKSRKIAADTARIGMTNLFGTFTLEDEDIKDAYNYSFKDVWNSIFHVRNYYDKEYHKRKDARDVNRANIVPGTRVHVRAGYGGDASKLPVLFNGVVAEIESGDIMTLVCQGNGIQLSNPSMFNSTDSDDVADLAHNAEIFKSVWSVFSNRSTPRSILTSPLVAKGTFVQNFIKKVSNSRFFNANPFGITSFGDRDMKEIFSVDGEVCQNIYEGLNASSWNTGKDTASLSTCYSMEETPMVRVELQGNRSYWDLMNIAASISPDYISAVADFDLRSTIFHGHPRYYYAYSYIKDSNGHIIEKRKPFQQYHVFTSESDIIGNMIMASQKDIRTNARGIYTGPGVLTEKVNTIGPLFLDINIFPENQKSTTINCNFEYKASDFPLTVPIKDWYQNKFSDTGGYEIAWRATANGLRETVKEMYKGELVVVGYPSIKPYDRFYLSDTYEDMSGLLEVQQVVHTLSADVGFVTTVTPDCVSSIMDDYDKTAVTLAQECLLPALGTIFSTAVLSANFIKTSRAMFMTAANFLGDTSKGAASIVNSIAKSIGTEDIILAEGLFPDKDIKKLRVAAGITDHDYNLQRSLHKLENAAGKIPKGMNAVDFKTRADMLNLFDEFDDFVVNSKNLDPSDLSTSIDDALSKGGLSAKDKKTLEGAKEYSNLLGQEYEGIKKAKNVAKIEGDDIKVLLDAAVPEIEKLSNSDELMEMVNDLRKLDKIEDGADFAKDMKKLKTVTRNITKIDGDTAKTLSKISKTAFGQMDEALDGYRGIKNSLKGVKLVKAGGKLAAIGAAILPTIIAMGAEFIITKSAQNFIEKSIKNMQVLTVFPIMKNGKAYTAGILGHQGSVYVSGQYEEQGHFQKMISKFFQDDYDNGLANFGGFIRDLFLDTGRIRELLNQQQKQHMESDVMLKNNDGTLAQKDMLHALVESETSGINAYKQLYLVPRFSLDDQKQLGVAVAGMRFENISDIQDNRRIMDELSYIFSLDACSKLREAGVLKFSAEGTVDENDSAKVKTEIQKSVFKMPGSDISYECRVIDREGKFPIYDIPYIKSDAVILLTAIVEKIANKIQPDWNETTCDYKELHHNNIVIHNGTRINDSSYYNTGLAFSIEVKNSDILSNILKEVHLTQNTSNGELFKYRKDKKLNNVFEVFVAPRK